MEPVVRPYQKFLACFILSLLFLTGVGSGLAVSLTVSPTDTAKIYYHQAVTYHNKILEETPFSSRMVLLQEQARFYLHRASLYDAAYDPYEITHFYTPHKKQQIINLSNEEILSDVSAAFRLNL